MELAEHLQAVIENPDADEPRLRAADALEQAGEGQRAEFIRAQCEHARAQSAFSESHPMHRGDEPLHLAKLRCRARDLLKGNTLAWSGAPEALAWDGMMSTPEKALTFCRGFVTELKLEYASSASMALCLRLFGSNPIQALSLEGFNAENFAVDLVRALQTVRLKQLTISAKEEPSKLSELFDASGPPMPWLEELSIYGVAWSEHSIAALGNSERFPRLRGFTRGTFPTDHLKQFVNSPIWSRLRKGSFVLDDAGVHVLATARNVLETLELASTEITLSGAQALAGGDFFASLSTLAFRYCEIEPEALLTLVNTAKMPLLSRLELYDVCVDETLFESIANAPIARTLQHLELNNDDSCSRGVDDQSLSLLAQSHELKNLKTFSLLGNCPDITLEGFEKFRARFGDILSGVYKEDLVAKAKKAAKLAGLKAKGSKAIPGLKFADNLKLVVIEALRKKKLVPEFNVDQFYELELEQDAEDRPYGKVDPLVLKKLLMTPISLKLAGQIETLVWESGSSVFEDIVVEWNGEDDAFHLDDLSGVDQLLNLRCFKILYGFKKDINLSPLARAPKLEEIYLCGGYVDDLGQMLPATALRRVRLEEVGGKNDPCNLLAVEAMQARGVTVTWTS
jgi:uncharacterized protein (TIGR02996 family)